MQMSIGFVDVCKTLFYDSNTWLHQRKLVFMSDVKVKSHTYNIYEQEPRKNYINYTEIETVTLPFKQR